MDNLTPQQRSKTMASVRGKDTRPELVVRRLTHRAGYRYRLHEKSLPGKPDLVFPRRNKLIFVHGCFWHGHSCRSGLNRPTSNKSYWLPKLDRNKSRDKKNRAKLRRLGWKVLAIWECQVRDEARLTTRIQRFLESPVNGK